MTPAPQDPIAVLRLCGEEFRKRERFHRECGWIPGHLEKAAENTRLAEMCEMAVEAAKEERALFRTMLALTRTLHAESNCGGSVYEPCTVAADISRARALLAKLEGE